MNNTTTSTTPTLMAIDQPGCRINSDTPQCPWDCYQLPGPEEAGRAEFARSLAWLGSRTDAQRRDWLTAHRPSILNGTLAYSDFT